MARKKKSLVDAIADYDPTEWPSRDAARQIIDSSPGVQDARDSLGKAIHKTVRRHLGKPFFKKMKRG